MGIGKKKDCECKSCRVKAKTEKVYKWVVNKCLEMGLQGVPYCRKLFRVKNWAKKPIIRKNNTFHGIRSSFQKSHLEFINPIGSQNN
jgi:hypothetical protein